MADWKSRNSNDDHLVSELKQIKIIICFNNVNAND
jgi:hypothetical protein